MPARKPGIRADARLGPGSRLRAHLGDRGLPPCLRLASSASWSRAASASCGPAEADGRSPQGRARARASRIRSTRWRSPAPRSGGPRDASRGPSRRGRRSRSSSCSTTARTWSRARSADQNRLRWHLHDRWPELELPVGLPRSRSSGSTASPAGSPGPAGRRGSVIAPRAGASRSGSRTRRAERARARAQAPWCAATHPRLLELPGCAALTAAKLVAEIAGVERFCIRRQARSPRRRRPDPGLLGQDAPPPPRPRRQPPAERALHRIAVTQGRAATSPARDYLARKEAEGKGRMEALRCLKRQLARVVWRTLRPTESLDLDLSKMHTTSTPAMAAGLT